jgi:hypothetical protein
MRAIQSTVCQCGHERLSHIGSNLNCVDCECRKFAPPAVESRPRTLYSNICRTCGAEYGTRAELDAHLKAYRERIFQDL